MLKPVFQIVNGYVITSQELAVGTAIITASNVTQVKLLKGDFIEVSCVCPQCRIITQS